MKTTISRTKKAAIAIPAALICAMASTANAGEWSANASMTSNYIWRGLTQTENEAAVQGGIDYAADNGFYIGTWASNVNYGAGDVYSYEHDVYAGYAFSTGDISWDVGYLYYNYDSEAEFDFGEVYVGMGIGDFSVQYNLLANTEADEGEGQDFGFGEAYYLSLDYGFELSNGVGVGLHIGHHDGDFAEAFNGNASGYTDYNYDSEAEFDFGEVYVGMGIGDFSVQYNLLANTEADEAEGQDFGFGEAYYLSLDYGFELSNGVGVGLHIGHHDGDFAEAFNGNASGYTDYNVSFSKDGFTFMISDTNVKGGAAEGGYDNDSVKFVVSYAVDIAM